MTITLPKSPVRKIHRCIKCNNVSLYFWDPKYDRSVTTDEWMMICEQGKNALRNILQPITEDPKFFLD
jgi:hypothetical protein